jgi:uncharacterized membrane protein YfcA
MAVALAALAVVSGMMGLGVAFAAVPFLGVTSGYLWIIYFAVLLVIGAAGAFVGARITSLYVPGRRLKQIFGVLIVAMTAYKLYQIAT